MKKSVAASSVLLISSILVFLLEMLMIFTFTFSLVLLILVLYLVIVITIIYAGDIQKMLKRRRIAAAEEKAKWNGII